MQLRRPTSVPQAVLVPVGTFAAAALLLYVIDRAAGWPPQPGPMLLGFGCSAAVTGWERISAVRRRLRPDSIAPEQPEQSASRLVAPPGIPADVYELVRQDRKVLAIRRYRQVNRHVSLKEAKDIIDAL